MKPTNKKFLRESGRSMLEMLSVLAVMAVITVGGISGYRYAMNKHKTNELIEEANRRAYTVSHQIAIGLPLNLSEFSNSDITAGGEFSQNIITSRLNGQFGIQVQNVSLPVCKQLFSSLKLNNSSLIRKITDLDLNQLTGKDCKETNSLVLIYNNDIHSRTDKEIGAPEPDPSPNPCSDGYFQDVNGDCQSCSDEDAYDTTEQLCSKCNGTRTMVDDKCVPKCSEEEFHDLDFQCRACSDTKWYLSNKSECDSCNKTDYPRDYMENGRCILKLTCQEGYFETDQGNCQPCNTSTGYGSTEAECDSCKTTSPRVYVIRSNGTPICMKPCAKGRFMANTLSCKLCSDTTAYETTAKACSACDDTDTPREYASGFCSLPTCASGTFQNTSSSCIPCSQRVAANNKKENWKVTHEAECTSKCGLERRYEDGYCLPNCPSGYFQNANGNCTDCGLIAGKVTSQTECDKCNNYDELLKRSFDPNNGQCKLTSCRAGSFKCSTDQDSNVCRPCSDPDSYTASASECAKCNGQRTMINGKCAKVSTPSLP